MEFNITTIAIILVIVLIGFALKKLVSSEEKKNDPNLSDPRDTNTDAGNQGIDNKNIKS